MFDAQAYEAEINQAVDYIKSRTDRRPEVMVILGSFAGPVADALEDPIKIPYAEIPNWPRSTVVGHAGNLLIGKLGGKMAAVLQGRVHFYEGYPMTKVTFSTRVMARLGAKMLCVTNAAGCLAPGINPGDVVLVTDHINMLPNPLIGPNLDSFGVRFPDMSKAYDPDLINIARFAAYDLKIDLKEGTYIAISGPSFETPAEIRMASIFGAAMSGMSTVPEVIVANHCGMKVLCFSCASNLASGISKVALSHQEVADTMAVASKNLTALVLESVKRAQL
ncbi:MAG: purine-nucleoside phosphorylase [Synergistaceae bacterium]|nr:purine-nucleoside phosphorylase [Synergistaceae bacterium]